jgi:predicted DNA-binding transcriptional regulator YafY
MIPSQLSSINQAQRERLFHIDFRLFFLGTINRHDLESRFGIKQAAATRDISLYKELAPKNMEYDTKAKTYIHREGFSSLFNYSSHQALSALLNGFGDDFVTTNPFFVPTESPAQLNLPSSDILAIITRAIYTKQALTINYRSLSSGLTQREFIPHALVDNGLRWHVRGFDRQRKQFADFVINRIEKPRLLISGLITEVENKAADLQWHKLVELKLIPHPALKYPDTIEHEYGMVKGQLTVQVRAAVAGYVLRHWNVDCSESHTLVGAEYHLGLKNRSALADVDNLNLAPGYSVTSKGHLNLE